MTEPIVEYATLYTGGSMLVQPNDPELGEVYPRGPWIKHNKRHGQKIYRRTVIVLEDWTEVTDQDH